jgi:hypothetical protein
LALDQRTVTGFDHKLVKVKVHASLFRNQTAGVQVVSHHRSNRRLRRGWGWGWTRWGRYYRFARDISRFSKLGRTASSKGQNGYCHSDSGEVCCRHSYKNSKN